ncbi:diaminopimelate epimerase [Canibacter zhoujuaniae]|uniref:diaminopimelate epimerase n=1 Tax=Canibacter zhoujuaniae TaxID=2708343 RepID=UPI00141EFDA2|nr:diaminopimelate epimerase [Canibacter zhoujuaniae]
MSITLQFAKAHGTGNDFVLYTDADGANQLSPEQIAFLCDRRFGVGGDGLIRAVRTRNLPEAKELAAAHPEAEWFMDYYNADGSTAQMCGNGVRAYVHYLLTEGLIDPERRETIAIGTRAGVKDVLVGRGGYSVDLGRWRLDGSAEVTTQCETVARPTLGINLGNPHAVAAVPDKNVLNSLDLTKAPALNPAPAEGANVEFVAPDEQLIKDGVGQISMRVFERGVGETLSCGTGAVAAALAFRQWGGSEMPNNWRVGVPGGVLAVRMFPTEEGEHVSLSGPAEIVYRGEITLPAAV